MKSSLAIPPLESKGEYEIAQERIVNYLDAEYFSGRAKEGTRLPSVRALATQLGASTAVVHAVYRKLREEGRLVSTVGRGTFLVSPGQLREGSARRPCIAVSSSIHMVSKSEWGNAIVAAILKASTRGSRRVSILPFSSEVHNLEDVVRLLKEEVTEVDGLICFPMEAGDIGQEMLSVYAAAGKPVVRINAPEVSSTENFVSADYFDAGRLVGKTFLQTGRRRLLFISAKVPGTNAFRGPVSAAQRIAGLQVALLEQPDAAPLQVLNAESADREAGYNVMQNLLETGQIPDAIYTFGDFLALGAIDALQERGISVPDQVSVIGSTGLSAHEGSLSMIVNPYETIGEEAIKMVLACLENDGRPIPGVYLPMHFSPGGTTRPEENALLVADGEFRKKE